MIMNTLLAYSIVVEFAEHAVVIHLAEIGAWWL